MRTSLRLVCLMALGGFLLSAGTAWAQLADKKVVTLAVAKKLAAAAEEEAVKNKWNVVIVIVDDGGNLLYLQRLDETQLGSIEVAIQKAQTAVNFKRPSKALEEALVTNNRTPILKLPGAIPIEGGLAHYRQRESHWGHWRQRRDVTAGWPDCESGGGRAAKNPGAISEGCPSRCTSANQKSEEANICGATISDWSQC